MHYSNIGCEETKKKKHTKKEMHIYIFLIVFSLNEYTSQYAHLTVLYICTCTFKYTTNIRICNSQGSF